MNYEILNDAYWKAIRFDFNAIVTDCFDGQKLSLKSQKLFVKLVVDLVI